MSEYRKCYVTKNDSIKGSVLGNHVSCLMIRWMRRRFHRKKKKLPFVVVELKMDEIDQTNSQLTMDEEGRLLEIPKQSSEAELVKLESDLKESIDQLKEVVLERERESEEKEGEEYAAEPKADKQLPGLGEEELVSVLETKMQNSKINLFISLLSKTCFYM